MEWTARFARRRFVSRLFAAVGLTAAGTGMTEARTSAAPAEGRWQGASHPEDEWYDKVPGIHRFVFDTVSPDGVSRALGFASTYLEVNKSKYGLKDSDNAMIVIVRNRSTRFGYNDAMWAKYGKPFSEAMDN